MPKLREMIIIYVFYDGTVEIDNIGLSMMSTQLMQCISGIGIAYVCPKNKKKHYTKKLIEIACKNIDKEINEKLHIKDNLKNLSVSLGLEPPEEQ